MKKLIAMLGAVVAAATSAWAGTITEGEIVVGKQLTWSNAQFVGQTGFNTAGGDYSVPKLQVPTEEGLPAGTVLRIDEISFAKRSDRGSTVKNYLLVGSQTDTTKSSDQVVVSDENTLGGQARYTYTFTGNTVNVTVGAAATSMYFQTTAGSGSESIQLQVVTKNTDNIAIYQDAGFNSWCIIHELKATVVSFPARDPINYEFNVETSTWNPSAPDGEPMLGDTVTYTGSGTVVLTEGLSMPTTIGADVTLEIESGSISQSQIVANNGKILIAGGTVENPVVINEDGAVHSGVGAVEIAENAVLKSIAKGSGNRLYTITGASAATSTLILDSDHNWGMTYDGDRQSTIRNCKVVVNHEFWFEKNTMIDSSCDLVANAVIHLGWGGENATFEIGNLSGTGSFALTGTPKLIVNQTGNSDYTNFNFANLTVKANDGTVTLANDFAGVVDLTGRTLSNGWNPSSFGKTASTVKLPAFTGYIAKVQTIDTTLELTGDITLTDGYSPYTTTVTGIKGTGKFALTANVTADYHFKFAAVSGDVTFEVGAKDSIILPASYEDTVAGAVAKVSLTGDFVDYCARIDEALSGKNPGDDVSNVTILSESVALPATWSDYEIVDGKIVAKSADEVPGEEFIDGADEKAKYKEWADANGVEAGDYTTDQKAAFAIAYLLGATVSEGVTLDAAAQAKVDDLLVEIDLAKLVDEGETASLEALNDKLAEKGLVASLVPVTLAGASESTKLYQLSVKLIEQN